MRKAILQVADTGPLESLVSLLNSVGYECFVPNHEMRRTMRALGCDTVLEIDDLVKGGSYQQPIGVRECGLEAFEWCDLFVDIKAHRNLAKLVAVWPRLATRTAWYRINGGYPVKTPGGGDEINPGCPIITPNQWYASDPVIGPGDAAQDYTGPAGIHWGDQAFVWWPELVRIKDFDAAFEEQMERCQAQMESSEPTRNPAPPVCLIHNVTSWGYGKLVNAVRALGVRFHGMDSPDGLILHKNLPAALGAAAAFVHLKSNDCPGYAIYEAMAAGCPLVMSRRLIHRMNMGALLDAETCLMWDVPGETVHGRGEYDVMDCAVGIGKALVLLATDPALRLTKIMGARARLESLTRLDSAISEGFKQWLGRVFK